MARKSTRLGGVDIAADTTVIFCPGAINRDPDRFEDPHELRVDRGNVREHIAFACGVHGCPRCATGPRGRPSLLDWMGEIRVNESIHGPAGDRRYGYAPTYIVRGLTELHLQFTQIK